MSRSKTADSLALSVNPHDVKYLPDGSLGVVFQNVLFPELLTAAAVAAPAPPRSVRRVPERAVPGAAVVLCLCLCLPVCLRSRFIPKQSCYLHCRRPSGLAGSPVTFSLTR
jgi:hypothetical protein